MENKHSYNMIKTEYKNIRGDKCIMKLLNILKSLSHENRLRILNLINQQNLCVCEIEYIMQISQSNASRHLNKLKQAGIIYGEHHAQWVYYNINDKILNEYPFLQMLIEKELDKIEICIEDNKRLKEYQESELSCKDLSDIIY